MRRRDFGKASFGAIAAAIVADSGAAQPSAPGDFPKNTGLTKYVGTFITQTNYQEIPADVIELGRKSILDGLGLALAGSRAESGPISRRYVEQVGATGGTATVIGTAQKTSPRFAALLNGISIHADDFDDTQLAAAKDRVYGLLMHPTVPVLPAIFALAEQRRVTGKDWMLAYHLGAEVECKIAEAIAPRHYQDGFHTTGTCGPFGSAAACAKLLNFDLPKTLRTFGLAASHSGGLRENFGTMTKPYQAGHAAESGLVSAELVGLGWTAAEQILEADRGFFHAAGGTYDLSAILDRLGKPWTFASPGVSLKPYPSGSLTHPAMTDSDKVVRRPDVQEMIRRVNFYVDPEAESAGYDKMTSILKIHMKDGAVITGRADFGKGSPANPMSFDEAATKFRGCAEFAEWPAAKTEKIVAFTKDLESVPDMSALSSLLSAER